VPTTILVPSRRSAAALADLPDTELVRFVPSEPLPEQARDGEVMVVRSTDVDAQLALMAQLPKLRLVQTLTAGIDHWQGRLPDGVALSSARGAHGASTAEWAVAALLTVYRELREFAVEQTQHIWNQHRTDTLVGKRVLVLGAGDLGTHVRVRLEAFGAEASMVGRSARPGVHADSEVPELLPGHDAVILVLPLTEDTRGSVDAAFLARMPDGAVLVNAARGEVVETAALLAELQARRLRAALDVTDPEPLPSGHPLWTAPGVLITPHVAGSTYGDDERAWSVARQQIARYLAGERPDNLVG